MSKILIDEAVVRLSIYATAMVVDIDKLEDWQLELHEKATADLSEALRQALADAALDKMAENARELGLSYEQPAQQDLPDVIAGALGVSRGTAYDMMREALVEQAAQEPVAWMWRCKPYCGWPEWSVSLKRPADSGRDGHKRTEGYEDVPLYTTPPAPAPDPDELTIAYMSGVYEGKKIGAKEGRNKLATWMMQCGFATGHGDTLEELLYELDTEIEDRLAAIREKGGAA